MVRKTHKTYVKLFNMLPINRWKIQSIKSLYKYTVHILFNMSSLIFTLLKYYSF